MEWNSPLHRLVNHNEDLKKLLEKGYALSVDSSYLVVRDIPYLDDLGSLKIGVMLSKLDFIDQEHVRQVDHQIYFCGSAPHELNGKPIANLGGGPAQITLNSSELSVERSFSNKPVGTGKFDDHFAKIENYVALFSGPAMEKYPEVSPYTFKQYESYGESVFKLNDTLTSRAQIGDLSLNFKDDVVAIIGLGGTGAYILDYLSKTPVNEIRGFDLDHFHVHNAFRSPGKLDEGELGKSKADVYQQRYERFRHGVRIEQKFILSDSEDELQGVTFAFVCVDKGGSRSEIFKLLLKKGIPFIDVGMGLNREKGAIGGMLRTTYYQPEVAQLVVNKRLAPMADYADDEYRNNIQISELNALNASLAVIKYKQLRGFYNDDRRFYNMLFEIDDCRNVVENEV